MLCKKIKEKIKTRYKTKEDSHVGKNQKLKGIYNVLFSIIVKIF